MKEEKCWRGKWLRDGLGIYLTCISWALLSDVFCILLCNLLVNMYKFDFYEHFKVYVLLQQGK
jgi:hypothetical protein